MKKGIALVLISIMAITVPLTTQAETIHLKDNISITFKYPDNGYQPKTANDVIDMVRNPGKYSGKSGWSASVYQCNADGTSYGEYEGYHYTTTEEYANFNVSDVKSTVVGKYGNDIYEKASTSGLTLQYDPSTPIPSQYLPPKNGLGETGKYVVNHVDNVTGVTTCEPGKFGYIYTDYDFYVTGEFEVDWKEESANGYTTGKVYWEMERNDNKSVSDVITELDFSASKDLHVAVRNQEATLSLGDKFIQSPVDTISLVNTSKGLKGAPMFYRYSYEYTNKEIGWECSGIGDNHKCVYNDAPDWRAVREYNLSSSMVLDFQTKEILRENSLSSIVGLRWKVGEMDMWTGTSKENKSYYEGIKRAGDNTAPDKYDLYTQTHLPMICGDLEYNVELPSGKHLLPSYNPFHSDGSYGYFYPVDVDPELDKRYKYK